MAQIEIINIGAQPNDGEGDPLRTAFTKTNNNFANLFGTFVNTSNTYTTGNTVNQVIFETSADTFSQAQFYIQSTDPAGTDSQTIQVYAQINNAKDSVKFTGYGSTFFGTGLASFDMDVFAGNVRVLCSPVVNTTLLHFIGSQVMWIGVAVPGLDIALDGYVDSVVSTQNDYNVTTEA